MVSVVTIAGPISVVAVALAAVVLSVVFSGVALKVIAAADGSTVSARSFLLRGRTSLGGPRFCLGF